ncbi:MAG: molybdopterin-dependent oxidoreductase [Bacteroidota bacterium]
MTTTTTKSSACILCSQNCGIKIDIDVNQNFGKILGDKDHPVSEGYICQKATRLNYYQHQVRLTSPLRKKADGTFEEVSWETAIKEIADKLVDIRNTYGGKVIGYAGGGGQGNHIGGIYSSGLRAACDTPYFYSALAQEKTGNFWVNGKLFGRQNTNYCEPVAEADFVFIIGANPMQSHGLPKARPTINKISRNPDKTLVVVDPRLTETAKKADIFLQVKPGKDAYLLAAMLGVIINEGLEDKAFIDKHTNGFDEIKPHFMSVPVDEYAKICGVDADLIRQVARNLAAADTVAVRSDLGIEQSHNSTLNAYLTRLLFLVTGNFGKEGTNSLHTFLLPLIGHSKEPEKGGISTPVTGMKEICKLFPPNILPLEIDSDHPDRMRALIVESANPLSSYADIPAQKKAYTRLDLMVVIDVAMTETAMAADYVLPASSQFEKYESTFFNLEFPKNFFHFRHPVVEPLVNTLPEPEIHHRLVTAMGELPKSFPILATVAKLDRMIPALRLFPLAIALTFALKPKWKKYGPTILRATLGKALPNGAASGAVLWFAAHRYAEKHTKAVKRAGFKGSGYMLGESLFNAIINSPSGTIMSVHEQEEHWDLIRHKDKKVHLSIPLMLDWLDALPENAKKEASYEAEYPFNLMAGERRTYNANTIIRNPEWRKNDQEGALKVNPKDAESLGIESGDLVTCTSKIGSLKIVVKVTDEVPKGIISMPHGYGLEYPDLESDANIGAKANLLTSTDDCDPMAKTPYHKNVRVKLEKAS